MAGITGSDSKITFKKGATFGTATAGGANDGVSGQISRSPNPSIVTPNAIGLGLAMGDRQDVTALSPVVTWTGEDRYAGPVCFGEALLFGAESVSSGTSWYTHSVLFEAERNRRWATVAFHGYSAGAFEYPSAVTRKCTVTATPNQYVQKTLEFLANNEVVPGVTNTNTTLNNVTIASTDYRQIARDDDEFRINARGGAALSSSDALAVTQWTVEYNYSVEHQAEIRGSAGQGTPVANGNPPFSAVLTVTFKQLADFTYFTAQQAGTAYKAELRTTQTIGSSTYRCSRYFPNLVIYEVPDFNLQNPGLNPCTVKFVAISDGATATGMPVSSYPSVVLENTTSTSTLA